ncbi:hypothetical protein TRSC58_07500 [Trypanosoma rangeli SC58]|uniref:Uncharacterized protein n=1 Tax=Trypanosoma rangeli SC58 TaxID=429131 RepID=A0A061IV59_TRYRA|nr:hypothetical protein TRSC58_07500 [Trypanosoma rangeli SC58]
MRLLPHTGRRKKKKNRSRHKHTHKTSLGTKPKRGCGNDHKQQIGRKEQAHPLSLIAQCVAARRRGQETRHETTAEPDNRPCS